MSAGPAADCRECLIRLKPGLRERCPDELLNLHQNKVVNSTLPEAISVPNSTYVTRVPWPAPHWCRSHATAGQIVQESKRARPPHDLHTRDGLALSVSTPTNQPRALLCP